MLVDEFGDFWRGAGGDLFDRRDAMQLVARVDALRAVAGVKIDVEFKAGNGFQHRHAVFLGGARVDRRFVNDDVALLQNLPEGSRRLDQRREVGALVFVDRRRHGDDIDVARGEIGEIGRVTQPRGFAQFFVADFKRRVMAGFERGDARRVDVEPNDLAMLAELHRQWQTDVTQTDDAEFDVRNILDHAHGRGSIPRMRLTIAYCECSGGM
jgi:hypothetical protein